jgi:fatty acid desaturase
MNEIASLAKFTDEERKRPVIQWYRTKIPPEEMKALHRRSDLQGFIQTGGYLAILLMTAITVIYSWEHWPWWITGVALSLHGTVANFMINAVHELGHGTVFKTKALNRFFTHLFAFWGWINHEHFDNSHTQHHRYTLHPPDDLEVVLPIRLMVAHFLKRAFINPFVITHSVMATVRLACGRFEGEWEKSLFPASMPEKRVPTVRWARAMLLGHVAIAATSIYFGWWAVLVVLTFSQSYAGWLQFLCNNTQHIGLQDNVPDFRLCCRTFTLNPVVQFLYWQMNYHIEHHMYAAVPCYNLGRLHKAIKHDLPPCAHGIFAVWREILGILRRQSQDPAFQYKAPLPGGDAARVTSY